MGGKGNSRSKSKSTPSNAGSDNGQAQMQKQMKDQQAQMDAQMNAARVAAENAAKAAKAERERLAAEAARVERERQINEQNDQAASLRRQSESRVQSDFTKSAENQRRLDEQASKNYSNTVGGSGYNMGSAQQQKISAAGGTAGPASTNAPAMGVPQALAANVGAGGTQQPSNFNLPNTQGLRFGGM